MKKALMIIFSAVLALPVVLFPAAAGAAPAQESGASFKEAEGTEWILAEVKGPGKNLNLDRAKLEAGGMGGFFTIRFEAQRASGTGAPNRFFGPYSIKGGNRVINLGELAGTMMAAFREPDGLNEREYLDYLSKVTRWDFRAGKLELYSYAGGGAVTTLVYVRG